MNTIAKKKVPTATERNQDNVKKALLKSIRQILNELASDNLQIIFNASHALETEIKVFRNLSELNQEEGMKIPEKKYGKYTNSIKGFIPNQHRDMKEDFIRYLSEKCISEVFDYSIYNKVSTYIIEDGLFSQWPNTDCVHFRNGEQYWDMLEQYQPAGIIIYPVSSLDIRMGRGVLGIYLLDEENLIIGKLLIEFFDEDLAPKRSKRLRIPTCVSEI